MVVKGDPSFTCFGVSSSLATVCSGNGTCTATDTCQCNELATGTQCEIATCFGYSPSDPLVCGGHGTCRVNGYCTCNKGYTGIDCSVLRCYQISANTITVCSGRGTCVAPNQCQCEDGYSGYSCQFKSSALFCFGRAASESDVCSGHGDCINSDVCSCQEGYSGSDCSVTNCGSYYPSDARVCSGRGSCLNGICSCQSAFFGDQCEKEKASNSAPSLIPTKLEWFCNGLNASDVSLSSQMCSGNGKCIGQDICSCDTGFYGSNCEKFSCFGFEMDHGNVCGGSGDCISMNQCSCPDPYYGIECQQVKCLGIDRTLFNSTDYSRVCSGRGNCSINGCECRYGYSGDACENTSCFGLFDNDSLVCSGHGQCVDVNTCKCLSSIEDGYWFGDDCSVCDPSHSGPQCKLNLTCSDDRTCNNLGICSQEDNSSCICSENRYTGRYCDECAEKYYGNNCEIYCESNTTCNGHGQCSRDGFCDCFQELNFGYWKNGTCNNCLDGYYGKECRTHIKESKFIFDKFGYFVMFTIVAPLQILNKIEQEVNIDPICTSLFSSSNLGQLPLYCNFTISSVEYLEGEMIVVLPSDSKIIPGDEINYKILHFEDSTQNQMITIQSDRQDILPPLPSISTLDSTITYQSSIDLIGFNARNYKNLGEVLYFEWSLYSSSLSSIQVINSFNGTIMSMSGTNSKSIHLTNIPVGSHFIQLRLRNRFNIWCATSSLLNITRVSNENSESSTGNSIPLVEAKILLDSNPFYYTSDLASTATQTYFIKKQILLDGVEVNHPSVKVSWEVLNSANTKPVSTIFDYNSTLASGYNLIITKSIASGYGNYTIYLKVYNITTNELLITKTHKLIFVGPLTKITITNSAVTTFTSNSPDFPFKMTLNFPQSSFADQMEEITWECADDVIPDQKCDADLQSIISSSVNNTVVSVPMNVYMRRSRSVRIIARTRVGKYNVVANTYCGNFYSIAYSGWSDSNFKNWGYSSGTGHWFAFGPATSYSLYMSRPPNWTPVSSVGTLAVYDHLNNNQALNSYSNYLQQDNSGTSRILKVIPGNIPSSVKILKTVRSLTEGGISMELDMYFINENFIPPTLTFQQVELTNQTNGWVYFKIPFTLISRYHQSTSISFTLKVGSLSISLGSKNSYEKVANFEIPQFLSPFSITYSVAYFYYDTVSDGKTITSDGTVLSVPAYPLSPNLNARAFQMRMKYHVDKGFGGDISNLITSANSLFLPIVPTINA